MAGDDKVGYGKPPTSTRWKPGQSGNPGGRPKSRSTFLLEAAAILSEPVKARMPDGSSISLGALEAAYLALCKKALKGDDAALYRAIAVMLEVLPVGDRKEAEQPRDLDAAKRKLWIKMGFPEEDYPGPN